MLDGYSAHYCSGATRDNPREIGYFTQPTADGSSAV